MISRFVFLPLLVSAVMPVLMFGEVPVKGNDVIRQAMQPYVNDGTISGAVTLVVGKDGALAMDAMGKADLSTGRVMEPDALFWIASMTKPMTALAVMMMVEEGKLSLDDRVEKYLPEFKGQAGGRAITVKDLLTHTSGLVGNIDPKPTLAEAVKVYAAKPLQFEPGSKWSYNNPGINTLGRLVEVTSGMAFEDFMQERLFGPLEMKDTTFWLDEAQAARLAVSYLRDEKSGELKPTTIRFLNDRKPTDRDRMPAPAGGLFSTAGDLAKLYQMLLNGGALDGKMYVKTETLELMTTNQLGDMKVSFTPGMHMGLGFHIVNEPQGVTAMLSKGSFGHGGAYGTQSWIDPVRGLAMVLLIQRAGLPNSDGSEMRTTFQKSAVEAFGN
ncbi:beta-lactamase family protein [Phragmitibacter flavus]|uniref:Beta-lactamase family protein n=1 Tax=Phragmitibacter flavus TaxID=2576071 RepID=A0A5R8KC36_9BACT|nr:serine hydrolase domain-containing protein [Phragmitibacter flavus]TLD69862.1 beta-lactamase family protein [Phragmitibacter flavus]